MRVANGLVPDNLYINQNDKIRGIQEAQKGFNQRLKEDIRSNRPEKVKETLVNIMEETLMEPRSGGLEGVSETVEILVSEYTKEPDVISYAKKWLNRRSQRKSYTWEKFKRVLEYTGIPRPKPTEKKRLHQVPLG